VSLASGELGTGTRAVGERKNSRDHVLGVVPGAFFEPFCRSWWRRVCWRVRDVPRGGVKSEGSIGTIDASGRFIISRSSLAVNAASKGPRLPTIDMCFTVERERTSRTGCGRSYLDKEAGELRSIREISRETFPLPMSVTCESFSRGGARGRDGCCVYQCTRERAGVQCEEGGIEG